VSLCPDDLFAQLKKVRLSIPSIGTNSMLFGLAGEKGLFREVGLEVEQINMQGSLGVKALIGGDVGYSAASGSIITAALRGIDVTLVSILSPAPVFRMIGQKVQLHQGPQRKGCRSLIARRHPRSPDAHHA
jgi:ABC-type nitrate/sulfonate/bicarbonate transport system substrate-binding protein